PREVPPFVASEPNPVVTLERSGPGPGANASQAVAPETASSVWSPSILRGRLFDESRLHEVPQVEQRNLPRYEPEQGVPAHIQALDNPDTIMRLNEFARIGMERGGHKSFNLEPLREHYLARLGLENGQTQFKQLTDFMGAVSPVSADLATLRNAS